MIVRFQIILNFQRKRISKKEILRIFFFQWKTLGHYSSRNNGNLKKNCQMQHSEYQSTAWNYSENTEILYINV